MQSKKLRHSKYKNTGLLFELLAGQITADVLAKRNESTAKTLLCKYFGEGKELGKERRLYSYILTTKCKNLDNARDILAEALSQRKRLNNKELSKQKYNLIKEIKDCYPIEQFLRGNVRNYKTLASIYKLFEDYSSQTNKFDISEVCQAKECIIEHMTENIKPKSKKDSMSFFMEQDEDIRLLSYRILIENFNKKYGSMCEDQREILKEYINNVSNTNSLGTFLYKKAQDVKHKLIEISNKLKESGEDKILNIKLNEVVKQLGKFKPNKTVKDNQITALLLSYELIKEVKSKI